MSETPTQRDRLADVLRGVGAFVGLVVILVAVPYGLWWIDGSPLPSSMPDQQAITETLTSRDDGSFFVTVLLLAGWVGWATFAFAVIVEIPAAVRGVRAPRMPAMGTQQRLAAGLVAAIAAMLTVGPTAMAGSAVAGEHVDQANTTQWEAKPPVTIDSLKKTQTEQRSPAGPARPQNRETEPPPPADDGEDHYVVQPGDTLWEISSRELDDPTRYPEIFEASTDTAQSDGRRLTDPDLIMPGWELTIPDEASSVADTGTPQDTPERPAHEGGDDRASQSETTPPTDDRGARTEDSGQGGSGVSETDRADKQLSGGVGKTVAEEEPTTVQSATLAGGDAVGSSDVDDELDVASLVRTSTGVGAVLAAGVVGVLAARRAVQQRRRRAAQRLPEPDTADTATEVELRQVANAMSVEFVDRAMRTLTAQLAEAGEVLPAVRAARLAGDQFELYLAAAAELPAPFEGTADQGVWMVTTDADEVLSAEHAADYPAPYPSLVTLGHDTENAHLMVDLEHLGALGVEGDPEQVRAFITAIAGEYATSSWADDIRVTLVGDHVDLELLDTGRVRHVSHVEQLLDELTVRAAQDRRLLADSGAHDLAAARAGQVAAAAWTPEIVLVMTPLTDEQRSRLTTVVAQLPRVAIATVTTDVTQAEWTLRFTGEAGWAVLDPMGIALRPQLLDDDTYAHLLGLVTTAMASPVGEAEPELELKDVPVAPLALDTDETGDDEPEAADARSDDSLAGEAQAHKESDHAGDDAQETVGSMPASQSGDVRESDGVPTAEVRTLPHQPPRILMLGPVDIENPAGDLAESSKRGQSLEIAVYLALRPGFDGAAMDDALWVGHRRSRNTRNTAVSRLRRWLGSSLGHEEYLPRMDETYRLHPDVRSDWQDWQALLPDGPTAADTADLRAALSLVRGMPLSGRGSRRYSWADGHLQDMIAAIVDVSHELAHRALGAGDFTGARRAAAHGLDIEPVSELLWRDRLKAEARIGTRSSIDALVDELRDVAEQCGGDLEPETVELLDQLDAPSAVRPAS